MIPESILLSNHNVVVLVCKWTHCSTPCYTIATQNCAGCGLAMNLMITVVFHRSPPQQRYPLGCRLSYAQSTAGTGSVVKRCLAFKLCTCWIGHSFLMVHWCFQFDNATWYHIIPVMPFDFTACDFKSYGSISFNSISRVQFIILRHIATNQNSSFDKPDKLLFFNGCFVFDFAHHYTLNLVSFPVVACHTTSFSNHSKPSQVHWNHVKAHHIRPCQIVLYHVTISMSKQIEPNKYTYWTSFCDVYNLLTPSTNHTICVFSFLRLFSFVFFVLSIDVYNHVPWCPVISTFMIHSVMRVFWQLSSHVI